MFSVVYKLKTTAFYNTRIKFVAVYAKAMKEYEKKYGGIKK